MSVNLTLSLFLLGPRVLGDFLLVKLGTNSRFLRQIDITILDIGEFGNNIIAPWYAVDIDLHYLDVGHRGAEMSAHKRREVTVIVMR